MKMNFRSLFLVLGVVILLIVSVGCSMSDSSSLNNDETTQGSGEHQQTNMTTENDSIATLRAEPYIQQMALSWEYSLDVEIEDGKIYINDRLYEVSSDIPPTIVFDEGWFASAAHHDKIDSKKDTYNTLKKIQDCDSCYLIETDQDCSTGKVLAVYEIEDVFYFVRFFDNGKVMRIHYAPIIQEVKECLEK